MDNSLTEGWNSANIYYNSELVKYLNRVCKRLSAPFKKKPYVIGIPHNHVLTRFRPTRELNNSDFLLI